MNAHTHISIYDRVDALRDRATFFVSQRRKDIDLYKVLADCLAICEEASAMGLLDDLKKRVIQAPDYGRNRQYLNANADVYLVVGRLVFEGEKQRAATWRYTATLREAAKNNIASSDLVDWLRSNGGINALFKARDVKTRTAKTKTLNLNQQIEVPKDGAFTVTLRRDARGFFDVIEGKSA